MENLGKTFFYGAFIVGALAFSVFMLHNDEKDIIEAPKNTETHFSIVEYNGHSYIRYVEANFTGIDGAIRSNFQLLHNPDCKCKNVD
jgi:hypothetical protein